MYNKVWRDSSSLILVFRNSLISGAPKAFDYSLLMLKRSSKSKFMPNAYVFPGGVTDKNDFNLKWQDLIENCIDKSRLTKNLTLSNVPRPMLIQDKTQSNVLERDIAFRIGAIRETFEEAGILLYKGCDRNINLSSDSLSEWREKVCQNPEEFFTMCKHFNICPDVWSLYEWSDWLTPLGLKKQTMRRFDTVFYISFQDNILQAKLDNQEVTSMKYTDPTSILHDHTDGKLWLAPPQFWEISRIANLSSFDNLKDFSVKREMEGCETWLPILKFCTDGHYSIYPGDDLYPEEPDYVGDKNYEMKCDISVYDEYFKTQNQNRMLQFDLQSYRFQVNITDPLGHFAPRPLTDEHVNHKL